MSYVISVGGDPINPNPFTFSQISMTGNITLVWPSNTEDATYTATNWIDITSSAAYTVTMPSANEAPEGAEVVFYNYGSFTVTVNDADGGSITTVASGETKRVWITDNSTDAGSWRIANIGSGTTSADASMLAGYGLLAQAGQLSQSMPVTTYSTNTTINAGLRSYLADWTGGAGTFTLTAPATLGNNWFFNVKNSGSGTLTIDGNGALIDNSSTISVSINQGFTLTTDGTNFYSVGRLIPTAASITQLSKSVAGNSNVTLTAAEAAYSIIIFTGLLTGNIDVIVPANVNEWLMYNNTSGAYTLTVKTSAGTGVGITQGTRRLVYCDGTDVYYSDTVGTGSVTSIATGTGLSGGPITVSGTLSLANTAVVAGTYQAPQVTFNAQGQATAASNATTLTLNYLAFSTTSGIIGTTTNNAAAAGSVGEYVSASVESASAVALVSNTGKTVTSINLTGGDWDVWVNGYFSGAAATAVQYAYMSLSTVNNTTNGSLGAFGTMTYGTGQTIFNASGILGINAGPLRVSLTGTSNTYYMVAQSIFASGTMSSYGVIQARRVR